MVSLASILTILSVFLSAVVADDIKSGQTESLDEKMIFLGRWPSPGLFNYGYANTFNWMNRCGVVSAFGLFRSYPPLWFKEVQGSALARLSLSIVDKHISYRRDESTVACKNTQGQLDHLVVADCHQAVQALVSKKTSSAHCKSCAVKLVTPNGQLAAAGAPAEALHQAADNILKSCATGTSSNHARRNPDETSNSGSTNQQIAMVFVKGDGNSCDS